MERRIRTFAERRGAVGLNDYLVLLQQERSELDAFLDRVTINVSQLWRNPEQWRLLADRVLPELAAGGRLRAWSAGCSYGAEAYTLAAVAREVAPTVRTEIVGTDIDPRMVARAREGWFSAEDAREAPEDSLRRWFSSERGGFVARPELKRAARFEISDLLRASTSTAAFDLVLCRNVVIYFNERVRDDVHGVLAASLRPGGYLMVGSTERVSTPSSIGLTCVYPFVYRKA
jgi:chemotaxis protein methyltransferase CheR